MSTSPLNLRVICYITFPYAGTMTLNGLTNGYESPPSSGAGNPPVVLNHLTGPTTNFPLIDCCGGILISTTGGSDQGGYRNKVTYNLPDGSLLTINLGVDVNYNGNVIYFPPPILSAGSLFSVTSTSTGGSGNNTFHAYLTLNFA